MMLFLAIYIANNELQIALTKRQRPVTFLPAEFVNGEFCHIVQGM